ncbi:MAG: hypothetical protein R3C97_02670 [Geminicoccaceae bacterium]
MNAGIIILLTMAVVAIHLSVYQQMALKRVPNSARCIWPGTVADFASGIYLLDLHCRSNLVPRRTIEKDRRGPEGLVVDSEGTVIADSTGDTDLYSRHRRRRCHRPGAETGAPVSVVARMPCRSAFRFA